MNGPTSYVSEINVPRLKYGIQFLINFFSLDIKNRKQVNVKGCKKYNVETNIYILKNNEYLFQKIKNQAHNRKKT